MIFNIWLDASCQLNSFDLWNPNLIRVFLNKLFSSIFFIALDISKISLGFTWIPAFWHISGIELVLDVITGTPHFIASTIGNPKPSKIEIKHVGNVIIGNNVDIGSNCTIDRAAIDSTIIEDNVRIDNLVQIAHGVSIGKNTIIAAQSGISGSTRIGENCLLGGQVGLAGHINIGNNVTIAAKSGVTKNIKDNSVIAGFPAIDIKLWRKNIVNQYKKIKWF